MPQQTTQDAPGVTTEALRGRSTWRLLILLAPPVLGACVVALGAFVGLVLFWGQEDVPAALLVALFAPGTLLYLISAFLLVRWALPAHYKLAWCGGLLVAALACLAIMWPSLVYRSPLTELVAFVGAVVFVVALPVVAGCVRRFGKSSGLPAPLV